MSINDATRFDWDRLREASAAGHSPLLEREPDDTRPESPHKLHAPLLDKYIALADEEQRQQDLFVAQWDDYEVDEDEDVVNNPTHYNTGRIECIEAIRESMSSEAYAGYLKGNCMKYLWRYDYKGKPIEDLEKAQWYLAKLLKELVFDNE
ncbi:DUF3310 domain-containing protein [Gammaproteobacteria bacterium]|nr:DUF3310 domain-containing protein [Gammaproteobacteria bacterium]